MVKRSWPPTRFALPDDATLESISHNRQGVLQFERPDDSRSARLAKILAMVPGVKTALSLPRYCNADGQDESKPILGERLLNAKLGD